MSSKGPFSCYSPRYVLVVLVASVVILAAAMANRWFEKGSAGRIALALVQTAATGVAIVFPILGIRRLDELQQRIQLKALAFAFAGTGIAVTGYAWLEEAGLPHVDYGVWTWPLMAGLWAIGFLVANRPYS